jgi:hypothetical protein
MVLRSGRRFKQLSIDWRETFPPLALVNPDRFSRVAISCELIPALNLRFFATYSELREEIHTDGLISRDRQVARLLADLRRIFGLHSAFA